MLFNRLVNSNILLSSSFSILFVCFWSCKYSHFMFANKNKYVKSLFFVKKRGFFLHSPVVQVPFVVIWASKSTLFAPTMGILTIHTPSEALSACRSINILREYEGMAKIHYLCNSQFLSGAMPFRHHGPLPAAGLQYHQQKHSFYETKTLTVPFAPDSGHHGDCPDRPARCGPDMDRMARS